MSSELPKTPPPGRILVVDDEVNIRKGLQAVLRKVGHQVHGVSSGEEALEALEAFPCDVAIVDIRMPGMTGVELLAQVHDRWPHVAVVLLTGHGTLQSAMAAVKAGAHDYLLKPAQPAEIRRVIDDALVASRRLREQEWLMASLRTGLQRLDQLPAEPPPETAVPPAKRVIQAGDLYIDLQSYEVRRGEAPVLLTPSEFKLLTVLAQRAGDVIEYASLVKLALDYEAEPWEAKELIKRHVFALRQKIEPDPASPHYILNVRGVGYRLKLH